MQMIKTGKGMKTQLQINTQHTKRYIEHINDPENTRHRSRGFFSSFFFHAQFAGICGIYGHYHLKTCLSLIVQCF